MAVPRDLPKKMRPGEALAPQRAIRKDAAAPVELIWTLGVAAVPLYSVVCCAAPKAIPAAVCM